VRTGLKVPPITGPRLEDTRLLTFLRKLADQSDILRDDRGQDLIEYVLVVALIALAATAGMGVVASQINTAFGNVGNKLVNYTS